MPFASQSSGHGPRRAQGPAGTHAVVNVMKTAVVQGGDAAVDDVSRFLMRASEVSGHSSTGKRLLYAAASVLGHGAVAGIEALSDYADVLQLVPVPGLQGVGETLLRIWKVYKDISDNDRTYDQILELCVRIVTFLREQVLNAGNTVQEDLKGPITSLSQALNDVYAACNEYAHQSLTQRVFHRKDNKSRLDKCENHLNQMFTMLGTAVEFHILKHVLENPVQPHAVPSQTTAPQFPPGLVYYPMPVPETYPKYRHGEPAPTINASPNAAVPVAPSAPPTIAKTATGIEADEEQYRTFLQHDFHPALTLPLWSPSPVSLGAVGYLSKPQGRFTTLFNAFGPIESSGGHASYITSLTKYGHVKLGHHTHNRFTAVHRGFHHAQDHLALDWKMGYPTSRHPDQLVIQANKETAHLYTEKASHKYIKDLEHPKSWLRNYADDIIRIYGHEHGITKADLILVVGALDAKEHALFVSHGEMHGQVTFGVHTHAKPGQVWGSFSASGEDTSKVDTHNPEVALKLASLAHKVSTVKARHEKWDTVLITPLRPEIEAKEVSGM